VRVLEGGGKREEGELNAVQGDPYTKKEYRVYLKDQKMN